MANTDKSKVIPKQKKGTKSGAEETVVFENHRDAVLYYEIFKQRFLNINRWINYSKTTSFQLTDLAGTSINEDEAKAGYLVKIKLPVAGTSTGKGYDWVKIEHITDEYDPMKDEALLGIRVRPTAAPGSDRSSTAHFYTEDTTSTFTLKRKGLEITAQESGRNDVYNLQPRNIWDKVRNFIVGIFSSAGGSHIMWKIFLKNILSLEK